MGWVPCLSLASPACPCDLCELLLPKAMPQETIQAAVCEASAELSHTTMAESCVLKLGNMEGTHVEVPIEWHLTCWAKRTSKSVPDDGTGTRWACMHYAWRCLPQQRWLQGESAGSKREERL